MRPRRNRILTHASLTDSTGTLRLETNGRLYVSGTFIPINVPGANDKLYVSASNGKVNVPETNVKFYVSEINGKFNVPDKLYVPEINGKFNGHFSFTNLLASSENSFTYQTENWSSYCNTMRHMASRS